MIKTTLLALMLYCGAAQAGINPDADIIPDVDEEIIQLYQPDFISRDYGEEKWSIFDYWGDSVGC